jgi:hypothetical protein
MPVNEVVLISMTPFRSNIAPLNDARMFCAAVVVKDDIVVIGESCGIKSCLFARHLVVCIILCVIVYNCV